MSTIRGHWPKHEIPPIFGIVGSFCCLLYILVHPLIDPDAVEVYVAVSLVSFLYFLKKML